MRWKLNLGALAEGYRMRQRTVGSRVEMQVHANIISDAELVVWANGTVLTNDSNGLVCMRVPASG